MPKWIKFINEIESPLLVIIGNKVDLPENSKKVTLFEGEEFARKNGFLFFESSAKENINISKIFFHSLIHLPFFDQFKSLKDSNNKFLLEELEGNNSDFNNSPGNINDISRININSLTGTPNGGERERKRCKC